MLPLRRETPGRMQRTKGGLGIAAFKLGNFLSGPSRSGDGIAGARCKRAYGKDQYWLVK